MDTPSEGKDVTYDVPVSSPSSKRKDKREQSQTGPGKV